MRKWLNIYFNFSKREFNGILVLIALIALIASIPYVYEFFIPENDNLQAEIAALRKLILVEAEKNKPQSYRLNKYYTPKKARENLKKIRLFNFDPNYTSLQEWQTLGLSAKQAAVMVKYTTKGGRFRKKEDLQKMFVISPPAYKMLAPYIQIAKSDRYDTRFKQFTKTRYPEKSGPVIIALNSADTLELDRIKGIGPAFARRIIIYRNRLGGFYNKEQLKEVFGLDSVKYKEIKDQVSVDSRQLTMIHINTVVFEDLIRNPYLNFKQINAILQFRKQHGYYVNIADLKKVAILPAATVEKLAPYISFEHD